MPVFRIFTNDRGKRNGVPMYSCLMEVRAKDRISARAKCPKRFDAPHFAPAVAIQWDGPPTRWEREWLKKHVGN
jgi:hypothetical protein